MKIYTGFGDEGNTALFGGVVVKKDNARVEVYGTLDELNSVIGLLRSRISELKIDELLERIQNEIFVLSSEVATPDDNKKSRFTELIDSVHVEKLEKQIDEMTENLEPLKNFILPGGSESAAIAHVARTVCRRAERYLVSLNNEVEVRKTLFIYLNRLSDLFFVIARFMNKINNKSDVNWKGLR